VSPLTWPAVVRGAAMRATRVAARSRAPHWAWRVVLLAGTVFVLGVLCGERARAAEPVPVPENSRAAGVVSDAGSVLTGPSGTEGVRADSRDQSAGPVRAVVERTVEPVAEPVRDAVGPVRGAVGGVTRTVVGAAEHAAAGRAAGHRGGASVGDLAGKAVGGLTGKSTGKASGAGRNVPALPEVHPLPGLPKLPGLPSLPVLSGLTGPAPLPEIPGTLEAAQRTLPAPLAPGTGHEPAPESGRDPEPGSGSAGAAAGDRSTPGDRTGKQAAVMSAAAVHGPRPALADPTAGRGSGSGSALVPADGSEAVMTDGTGDVAPAPFPGLPGDRPDGSQGGRSAADHGPSRSGDLYAVAAHLCRPQPVLAPGARADTGASETRDRYEDVPVPPA